MNKGIVFLFIITLLLILIWNCIPFGYEYLKAAYGKELEENPILLISESSISLDSLKAKIVNFTYVDYIEIERDSIISNKLIEIYNLDTARSILSKYNLPDVMKIYLKGAEFDLNRLSELDLLIRTDFPELIYKYNNKLLVKFEVRKGLLLNVFYIANGLMVLTVLLILGFLRFHFEIQKNTYWKIFREAGGHSNYRNRQYWLNSLILITVPLGLAAGSYFILQYYNMITFVIDPFLFGIEFVILLFSSILTRLFLGAKF